MSNSSGLMYRERLAAAPARADLACVWMQSSGDDSRGYEHRTVPNGSVEVAYRLGTNQITVTGPQREPTTSRLEPGTTIVGVRFRPGAAAPIVGVPASELLSRTVGLEELWGRPAVRLAEQLAEISAPQVVASLLEKEISRRSPKTAYRDPVVLAAVDRLQPWHQHRNDGGNPLSGLFISPRQLRRRFVLALGYGPRTLRRVLRFQGFLALSNADRGIGIGQLAHAAGFADQAHLTRECVRLTGLTPQLFLAETIDCCDNHDHRASFAAVRRALLLERKSLS
jgi:AraC-like DNA-binding protein